MKRLLNEDDVIKIIDKYYDADECNGSDVAMDIMADIISLPSVQVEWGKSVENERPLADSEIIPRLQDIKKQIGGSYAIERAIEVLEDLSSTQSEQRWIPCSEKLPHTNGVYNVTRKISDGFECRNISDSCYYDGVNTWHDDTRVNHERRYITDVIAWMKLPESYREDGL